MAIQIEEYKNMNTASKTYGQYYGRTVDNPPLTLDELVEHIDFHSKLTPIKNIIVPLQQKVKRQPYGNTVKPQ